MGVCFGIQSKKDNYMTDPTYIIENDSKSEKFKIRKCKISSNRLKNQDVLKNSKHHSEEISNKMINNFKKSTIEKQEKIVLNICDEIKPVKFLDVNKYIKMIEKIDLKKKETGKISSM